nr:hypothetical protein [Tanacetum cinerariifolium]
TIAAAATTPQISKDELTLAQTLMEIKAAKPKAKGVIILEPNIPILTQPSSSQPQKKHKPRRKQREATEVPHTEPQAEERVPTPSNDPLSSGEDRMKLTELMNVCTNLQNRFLIWKKLRLLKQRRLLI